MPLESGRGNGSSTATIMVTNVLPSPCGVADEQRGRREGRRPLPLQGEAKSISELGKPGQRNTDENKTCLKRSTGTGLRCAFASRLAPCNDETTKPATSLHLKPAGSSPAFTAAFRQ